MKIGVIGQGYVGLSLALVAAESGLEVTGLDSNLELIRKLRVGETSVGGISKEAVLRLIDSKKYNPTSEIDALNGNEIIIIAVPTPLDSYKRPDLQFLRSATLQIANSVDTPALIINESTSYPGTLRNFIKPLLDLNSPIEFAFAAAPERIDPGNKEWTINNTPRVVSGLTPIATQTAVKFYQTICREVVVVDSPEIAEASKIFENTFRQVNIALANEFSNIANNLGFSAHKAILAASSKPFGFMPFLPSIGVGGHCIPVDPSYLSYVSESVGVKAKLIDLANEINLSRSSKIALKIAKLFNEPISDKKIQIVGIAYKPNVEDMRESPALLLIEELRNLGFKVKWHDPIIREFQEEKSSALDPDIDLGLIVTPHEMIDLSIWKNNGTKVLDLSPNTRNYGWPKFF